MIASRMLLLCGIALALMGSNCNDTVAPVATSSCGGVLYSAVGATGLAGDLYTVDKATGASTLVGPIGHGVTGMAVAPHPACTVYATTATQGTNGELITINPTTGAGTVIATTDTAAAVNHSKIAGLTFVGTTLYGWSETGDDLVTIDTATGLVTVIPSTLITGGSGLAADSTGT